MIVSKPNQLFVGKSKYNCILTLEKYTMINNNSLSAGQYVKMIRNNGFIPGKQTLGNSQVVKIFPFAHNWIVSSYHSFFKSFMNRRSQNPQSLKGNPFVICGCIIVVPAPKFHCQHNFYSIVLYFQR